MNPPTPEPQIPNPKSGVGSRYRWLRYVVGGIVVLATFFFMARSLYANWGRLKDHFATLHFNWVVLPVPFVLYGLAVLATNYGWRRILAHFGERVSFWHSARIMAYSQFGKYLPGKVWAVLGRVYLAKEIGIDARHSAVSVVVETAYMLIAALVLFAFSLLFYQGLPVQVYLLLLLIPVSLVLIYPPIFNRVVNFLLVRLRQAPVEFRLRASEVLVLLLAYLVCWACIGFGFYFLTVSFYPLPARDLLIFPGAFAMSWIVGLLVVWAPGGLGVREGLFALLLNPIMTGAINVLVGLLSRIWVTLSEVLVFLVVLLISRIRRK